MHGVVGELALPCLKPRRPFEGPHLELASHLFRRHRIEKDLQTVFRIVENHLPALEGDLLVFPARRLLGFLTNTARHVGQFEKRMTFGNDRLAALGIPLADAGYGTVYDLDVTVLGMRGDTPEEVGDEKGPAISALLARVEAMDRLGRTVDVGLDLPPQLFGALLVRLQGFFVLLNGFECPLAPLAKRLVFVEISRPAVSSAF